jgi:alpha-mannosidase
VDAPNVILEWVKPAEDASGDIIVRLYEAKRMATRTTLSTTLPIANVWRTNMLEENINEVSSQDGKIALEFRPFEIVTLRLRLQK